MRLSSASHPGPLQCLLPQLQVTGFFRLRRSSLVLPPGKFIDAPFCKHLIAVQKGSRKVLVNPMPLCVHCVLQICPGDA